MSGERGEWKRTCLVFESAECATTEGVGTLVRAGCCLVVGGVHRERGVLLCDISTHGGTLRRGNARWGRVIRTCNVVRSQMLCDLAGLYGGVVAAHQRSLFSPFCPPVSVRYGNCRIHILFIILLHYPGRSPRSDTLRFSARPPSALAVQSARPASALKISRRRANNRQARFTANVGCQIRGEPDDDMPSNGSVCTPHIPPRTLCTHLPSNPQPMEENPAHLPRAVTTWLRPIEPGCVPSDTCPAHASLPLIFSPLAKMEPAWSPEMNLGVLLQDSPSDDQWREIRAQNNLHFIVALSAWSGILTSPYAIVCRQRSAHPKTTWSPTHLLALSFSISLLSTSSALSTSNRVLNSSASDHSRHTLFSVFGPLPSLGVRPHPPSPSPVLSFIITPLPPTLVLPPPGPSAPTDTGSRSPAITPHSIASFLCLMSSSCTACAISGTASPDSPSSAHSC